MSNFCGLLAVPHENPIVNSSATLAPFRNAKGATWLEGINLRKTKQVQAQQLHEMKADVTRLLAGKPLIDKVRKGFVIRTVCRAASRHTPCTWLQRDRCPHLLLQSAAF